MVEVSRFFESAQYNEPDQAEVQKRYRPNGVLYEAGNRLAVTAPGGMFISVADGESTVEGFWYKNTAALTLAIAANASGSTRVDTVILRLDRTANAINAVIKQGTPGAGAPTLVQIAGGTYELPLWDITIPTGTLAIAASNLTTDRRTYGKIIHHVGELDTATLDTLADVSIRRAVTFDPTSGLLFTAPTAPNKNYIDNPTFRHNQLEVNDYAASWTICDRWWNYLSVDTTIFTPQVYGENGMNIEDAGMVRFTRNNTTAFSTNGYYALVHGVEGIKATPMYGLPMTISFWSYSTKAGTFPFTLWQSGTNWHYPTTFVHNVANTWEFKTITIPWTSNGTWQTGAVGALFFYWYVGSHAGLRTATHNVWVSSTGADMSSQGGNPLTATGDFLQIAMPKLESGSLATRFEIPDYAQELMECQRYMYVVKTLAAAQMVQLNYLYIETYFPVPMRGTPQFTPYVIGGGNPSFVGTGPSATQIAINSGDAYVTGLTYQSWALNWSFGNRYAVTDLRSSTLAATTVAWEGMHALLLIGNNVRMRFKADI